MSFINDILLLLPIIIRRDTMRKKRYIIFALLVVILCITGCGKDKKQNTDEATAVHTTADAVSVTEEPTTSEPEMLMDEYGFILVNDSVRVISELANVYVSADQNSAIYMLADRDKILTRTGYNDVWTRIVMENTSFYVLNSEVEVVEQVSTAVDESDGVATSGDASRAKIIVIDPGNQAASSVSAEEIGPGSSETKACATAGITGSTFGTKESELNLKYALLLKSELESRGYQVIMTRETNDVDLSNKQRADIANSSSASAYIRIEMNSSSNSELNGVMAVCMTQNSPYNSSLYQDSRALATRILQGITESVSVNNCGIFETEQMTAINWSSIPVAEIHLGFLTNATDEGNLISEEYQNKLVLGIADGIDYFIK